MIFIICLLLFVQSSAGKKGLIQEILQVGETTADVLPSIRSLVKNQKAVHANQIDNFDAVAKQNKKYVQKVRGFFKAPESGEYKFYSSCSGPCEVYIGQESSLKPRRIISQREESLHNEFDRYPDQVSHTIYLEQDKLYYIEGVEKQNGGLGHLSVGVVLPSDKKLFPISKSYLRTDAQDKGNRKEEISREGKQDLTNQRDTMFKKLRELNDYIQDLTEEVKRKSTDPNSPADKPSDLTEPSSLSSDRDQPAEEKNGLNLGDPHQTLVMVNKPLNNLEQSKANVANQAKETASEQVIGGTSESENQQSLFGYSRPTETQTEGQERAAGQSERESKEIETARTPQKSEDLGRKETEQKNVLSLGKSEKGTDGKTQGESIVLGIDGDKSEGVSHRLHQFGNPRKSNPQDEKAGESRNDVKALKMVDRPQRFGNQAENEKESGSAGVKGELPQNEIKIESPTQEKQANRPKISFKEYNIETSGMNGGLQNNKEHNEKGEKQSAEEPTAVLAIVENTKTKPNASDSVSSKSIQNEIGGTREAPEGVHKQEPEKKEIFIEPKIQSQNGFSQPLATTQHSVDVSAASNVQNVGLTYGHTNLDHAAHGFSHDQHEQGQHEHVQHEHDSNANLVVEHGYFKLHKTGSGTPDQHTAEAVSLHAPEQDDEDVMQLTNYAKQEIARHGNLSESVIRHLVKIIKEKILSDGLMAFNKRQNMTKPHANDWKESNLGDEASPAILKSHSTSLEDNPPGKSISKQPIHQNEKVDVYDHVISTLMKSLKKNLLTQKADINDPKQTVGQYKVKGQSADLHTRSEFRTNQQTLIDENTKRNNRILSSLNHLSSELENVKTFLRTKQASPGQTDDTETVPEASDVTVAADPLHITPSEADSLMAATDAAADSEKGLPQYDNQQLISNDSMSKDSRMDSQFTKENQMEQTASRKDTNPVKTNDVTDDTSQAMLSQNNQISSTTEKTDKAMLSHETASRLNHKANHKSQTDLPVSPQGMTEPIENSSNRGRNVDSSMYSDDGPSASQPSGASLNQQGAYEPSLSPNSYQSLLLKTVSSANNDELAPVGDQRGTQDGIGPMSSTGVSKQDNDVTAAAISSQEKGDARTGKEDYDVNSFSHQSNSAKILNKLKSPTNVNFYTQLLENEVGQLLIDPTNPGGIETKESDDVTSTTQDGKTRYFSNGQREQKGRSTIGKRNGSHKNIHDEVASKKTEITSYYLKKAKKAKNHNSRHGNITNRRYHIRGKKIKKD